MYGKYPNRLYVKALRKIVIAEKSGWLGMSSKG